MSNNMNTPPTIRWQLLSTVSAVALLASAYTAEAAGNEAERPLIWIELGGQMENVSGQGEIFSPAFLSVYPTSPVLQKVTPLQAQKPPVFSFGEYGKISFQQEGPDWIFSAAVRVGRSSSTREVDHQTGRVFTQVLSPSSSIITTAANFADTQSHRHESHAILDFDAGKDVGIGLFGKDSLSTIGFGVRFAQFTANATLDIRARPDLTAKYVSFPQYYLNLALPHFHSYHATGQASRSFRGAGPSLSWNSSVPFVGNQQDGELTFDWGANAAILFGKQKARVRHHESGHYKSVYNTAGRPYTAIYQNPVGGHSTNRSVTVPNVGGSVGLSWRVQDFKVSMGYRADLFFGAMDSGIDARKSETLGFKGPYASISVGLGD
jgi:iron complex outermembrane receptor protein